MEDLLEIAVLDGSNFMDDIILNELLLSRQEPTIRSERYGRFNLENMTQDECIKKFRFEQEDIITLAQAFELPAIIKMQNRCAVSGVEGLCICLRRLTYPNRLSDLESLFGLSAPYLSAICNKVTRMIVDKKAHLLLNLENNRWLNKEKMQYYSNAIFQKGAPLRNCWGFIDGTARPICRPCKNQQEYYSGHKRQHCVKYQSLLCPDGMIVNLQGPYPGRRHDGGIYRDTKLHDQLRRCAVFENENYVIYGDSAYSISDVLLKPYSTRTYIAEEIEFNVRMSKVRVTVEWGFGKTIRHFAFLDFKKNQKLDLQDITSMYFAGTILSNCHSCLYGNEVAKYFKTHPPSLQEYLQ